MGNVRRRLVVLWILLVASAALPGLAQTAGPMPGRWNRGGDPMQTAIAKLNLTDEQQTKVKAISDQETAKIGVLRGQIRPAHDALDAVAQAEKPDPATVGRAYLNLKAMEEALQAESAKFQDAVADVLTKEQKAEFETYLSGARDNRMRWGGPPRTN